VAADAGVTALRLMREGQLEAALPHAREATRAATVCRPEHGMLATILCRLGRREEADGIVRSALHLGAGSADSYDALAHVSIMLGQSERANTLYRQAVALEPLSARFLYNLASSERSLGRLAEAEVACSRSIELDPHGYPSYLLRSELRTQTAAVNHVAELEARLAADHADERARVALGYALAKELDDLGHYDEAFRWLSQAAQTRRRQLSYDVAVDERKIERIMQVYSVQYPQGASRAEGTAQLAFIVGLPRSGTTLLERILTGVPGVRTNGETDNFSQALLRATPSGQHDVFTRATHSDPEAVARNYADLAGSHNHAGLIIEKLPLNYLYLGAIARALPNARLLWMRRSPVDSCFAMYRTLFGQGYPFSYDFEDLARYYNAYARLMEHWQSVLGPRLYPVSYEELVTRPDAVGASLAAHCGLQWSDSAVHIENNTQASFTASASQVRRPIYTSSIDRWRHYRTHLEPLISKLREFN
jgi:tetratricopeptide (TPR) repeat protein